ncbi:MAG: hypothetical protein IPN71_12320 [Fibrobacteres bacterium]|nr:hypothetical protein [Fibrobacterota bacterium]
MGLRAYSIASAGFENEVLQFHVAHVPEGTLTPRLWTLNLAIACSWAVASRATSRWKTPWTRWWDPRADVHLFASG